MTALEHHTINTGAGRDYLRKSPSVNHSDAQPPRSRRRADYPECVRKARRILGKDDRETAKLAGLLHAKKLKRLTLKVSPLRDDPNFRRCIHKDLREIARLQHELAPSPENTAHSVHRRHRRRQHRSKSTDPDDEADDAPPSPTTMQEAFAWSI